MEIMLIVIGLSVLWACERRLARRQERKHLEAEHKAQLQLEAQRFEKIKEILTDGVIEGSPKALDALKPLVEIMAHQMSGPEFMEREKLLHTQRMREIRAKNEPYRLYAEQIERAQDTNDSAEEVRIEVDALRRANEGILPRLDDVPLPKSLPPEATDEEELEEVVAVKR